MGNRIATLHATHQFTNPSREGVWTHKSLPAFYPLYNSPFREPKQTQIFDRESCVF